MPENLAMLRLTSHDLDGIDAAHKAVILGYLAHGIWIDLKGATVEGIRRISNEDLSAARI